MTSPGSIGSLLHEILGNLQEMVRAEVALAKREVTDDLKRAQSAMIGLVVGAGAVVIGAHFVLWSLAYALALRLPLWQAVGIVGSLLLLAGAVATSKALKRWRVVSFTPDRTVASVKENVGWLRQLSK